MDGRSERVDRVVEGLLVVGGSISLTVAAAYSTSTFTQWAAAAAVGFVTAALWIMLLVARAQLRSMANLGVGSTKFALTLTEANQELANITAVLADTTAKAIIRLYDLRDPLADELAVPALDAGARFTEHYPDLAAAAESFGKARP